jgi:DNA (cytosine-5)-methyltransferase 1
MHALENELEYDVHEEVLDAVNYVPQHRERIFIVGFRKPVLFEFPHRDPVKRPKFPRTERLDGHAGFLEKGTG